MANVFRILFWFGHAFDLALLIQSFVMIAGMLVMMHLCVKVNADHRLYGKASPSITVMGQSQGGQNGPYVSSTTDGCCDNFTIGDSTDTGLSSPNKKETTPIYSVLYSNQDRVSDSPSSVVSGKSYSPTLSLSLVDSAPRKLTNFELSTDSSDEISENRLASSSSMIQLTTSSLVQDSQNSPPTIPESPKIPKCKHRYTPSY